MIYLSNKELYKEIVVSKNTGKLTRTAQKMFDILVERVLKIYNLDQYTKEECRQTAYLHLYQGWFMFNEEYENAFSYYTEIIKHGINSGFNILNERKKNGYNKIEFISYSCGDFI
jgi:hypothetical protein